MNWLDIKNHRPNPGEVVLAYGYIRKNLTVFTHKMFAVMVLTSDKTFHIYPAMNEHDAFDLIPYFWSPINLPIDVEPGLVVGAI